MKTKILFICHGNICRSPMAEFVFLDLLKKKGVADLFHVESRATSYEEIGNHIHHGTLAIFNKYHIEYDKRKTAQALRKSDYEDYDLLIGMDYYNIVNIKRYCPSGHLNKIKLLSDYAQLGHDIQDPWYSGDFEKTYQDIKESCLFLLNSLLPNSSN